MKFEVGDEVIFADERLHCRFPKWYPKRGTKGVITNMCCDSTFWVQWERGSTSDNDVWCCNAHNLMKEDQK